MEEREASVPYFVHEGVVARLERNNIRLLIALIVAVVALVVNNVAWLVYEANTPVAVEETVDGT